MSDKLRFGEILVRAGVVDRSRLEAISAGLADADDLGEQLVLRGVVNETRMLQAVGQALNLPTVVLTDLNADDRALKLLNQEICEGHLVFPVELERTRAGEHLHVAMANPSDIRAIKQITRKARRRIRPLVASARDIREAIAVHYGGATPERGGASSRRESPVDMFDFNVTDLSGMEGDASQGMPELDLSPRGGASLPPSHATPELSRRQSASPPGMMSMDSMPSIDVRRSDPPPARAPAAPAPALDFSALGGASAPAPDDAIDLSALGGESAELSLFSEPVDLSAISVETTDLSALEQAPPSFDMPEPEAPPLAGLSMPAAPEGPPLAGLSMPAMPEAPPLSALSMPAAPEPPPAPPGPRRAPPTSMPPRPSSDPPGGDFGFGMIRRKRRRASQAPDPKVVDTAIMEKLDSEALHNGDRVVARYLERYQRASSRPGTDEFMTMLERAVKKSNSPTVQLVLILTRHLAARDLIDIDEVLAELLGS